MDRSKAILGSWEANAGNWIATIENGELESRLLVTNDAIVDAILNYNPPSILDIGCGEGWLSRSLREKGIDVYGVDAVEGLVTEAIKKDGPFYTLATFNEIAGRTAGINRKFHAAVVNFSLLDKDDAESLVKNLRGHLHDGGLIFIQTLHPFSFIGKGDYKTGWKDGSWDGLKRNFEQPYQWYFRTLESWIQLFQEAHLKIKEIKEPLHPVTKNPASVIFVLQAQQKLRC